MHIAWMGTLFDLNQFPIIQAQPEDGVLTLILQPNAPGAMLKIGEHEKVVEMKKELGASAVSNAVEVAYGLVAKALADGQPFLDLSGSMNSLQMKSPEQMEAEKNGKVTEGNFGGDSVA